MSFGYPLLSQALLSFRLPLSLHISPSKHRRVQQSYQHCPSFRSRWLPPREPRAGLPSPKPAAEQSAGQAGLTICNTGEPLPAKLVQALRDFAFVEMHWFLPSTLLPPGLSLEEADQSKCCCHPPKAKKSRKTVADLATWQLCYNRYTAALCAVYPGMLPQMLAYANIIIQAQLQFLGDGWLTYDRMFRTAAATRCNTEWRNVDASLYARFVSCQPRRFGVCQVCCSLAHKSTACPWGVDEEVPLEQQSSPPGTVAPRVAHFWTPTISPPPGPPICTSWNAGSCRFRGSCNFRHICSFCFLPGHRNKECPTPPPSTGGWQTPWKTAHPRQQETGRINTPSNSRLSLNK